jgi:hypothetical protein
MELSFNKYYSQKQFQEVAKNLEVESDRLEESKQALLKIHEYLESLETIIDPQDQVVCEEWHKNAFFIHHPLILLKV